MAGHNVAHRFNQCGARHADLCRAALAPFDIVLDPRRQPGPIDQILDSYIAALELVIDIDEKRRGEEKGGRGKREC